MVTAKNLLRAVVAGLLLAGCADTPAELRQRQRLQDVEAQCAEWVDGERELSDRAQAMCAALGWDP